MSRLGLTALAILVLATAAFAQEAPAETVELHVIIDQSNSMWGETPDGTPKYVAAQRAVASLLDAGPAPARLTLSVMGGGWSRGCAETPEALPVRTPQDAIDTIARLRPSGASPIGQSLQKAVLGLGNRPGRVVFVTDGVDSCAGDPCSMLALLRQAHPQVSIEAVHVGGKFPDANVAQCLFQPLKPPEPNSNQAAPPDTAANPGPIVEHPSPLPAWFQPMVYLLMAAGILAWFFFASYGSVTRRIVKEVQGVGTNNLKGRDTPERRSKFRSAIHTGLRKGLPQALPWALGGLAIWIVVSAMFATALAGDLGREAFSVWLGFIRQVVDSITFGSSTLWSDADPLPVRGWQDRAGYVLFNVLTALVLLRVVTILFSAGSVALWSSFRPCAYSRIITNTPKGEQTSDSLSESLQPPTI